MSSSSSSSSNNVSGTIAFGSFSAACNSVQSYSPRLASDLNVAAVAGNNNQHKSNNNSTPNAAPDNNTKPKTIAPGPNYSDRELNAAINTYLNSKGYTVVKKLARGGFGVTSLVQHEQQQQQLVLKIQRGADSKISSFEAAFNHEVNTLKANANFGVVKLIDATLLSSVNASAIVLEFAEGGDLNDFLRTRRIDSEAPGQQVDDESNSNNRKRTVRFTRYLTEEEVCWLFVQMLLAVEHLHVNKSLHRDLKLKNVAVCETSLVKLLDFGLSRQYDTGVSNKVAHTQCGSPGNIAPEILTQSDSTAGGYNKLCDIFSLGIVLHDLMVGNVPPTEAPEMLQTNMFALMADTLLVNLPQPIPRNRYSKELCDLCARMISRNPQDRPQSIQEILSNSEANCPALAAAYKALREYVDFCCGETAAATTTNSTVPSHLQRYVLGPRGAWVFENKNLLPWQSSARVTGGLMKIISAMAAFEEKRLSAKKKARTSGQNQPDDRDDGDDRLGEFLELSEYPQEFVDLFNANLAENARLLKIVKVPKFRRLSSSEANEARALLLSAEAARAKYVEAKKQQQQQQQQQAGEGSKQKYIDEFAGALKMLQLKLTPVIDDAARIAWRGLVTVAATRQQTDQQQRARRYVVFTEDGALSVGRWEGDQRHEVFMLESVAAAACVVRSWSDSLTVKLAAAAASGRRSDWAEQLLTTDGGTVCVKPIGFVRIEEMLKSLPSFLVAV